MNYAKIKKRDIANGPGVRVSLYVSGCRHHCRGCFNPETWDFSYGKRFDESTGAEIAEALAPSYIRGLSLLGGEPFEPENSRILASFLSKIKSLYPDKQIWCYTGYDFEADLLTYKIGNADDVSVMLAEIDVLVDGEFMEEKKITDLRFRGSVNQRIIDVKRSFEQDRVVLWQDGVY